MTIRLPILNKAVLHRKLRVFGGALITLSMLGPFGTFNDFGILGRVAYWGSILMVCSIVFEVTVPGFLYNDSLRRKLSRMPRFVIGVLSGSIVGFAFVILIDAAAREPIRAVMLPYVFVSVTMIGGFICFISFMPPFAQHAEAYGDAQIDFERIAFFNKYPQFKGSRIHWIAIEDHYANVVTATGQVSLHATMRNLEKQLKNYPGMRIHRSYWVAHEQIEAVYRKGRTRMIRLTDGTSLPVGGTYLEAVERLIAERSNR
ncbi:LytTR family DNA-binding domain-containing protein [Cognatiyoonia sp. IB215182]|uniref:LytTR family DNA-binding domain-containing protein n=1 Tax=Cognatiyoonia sp. IB215182 TaxID=3097353 RepID=UPI002A15BC91|nr:LytTR family DNA-binding domain-containing protein [Cognatiyoonia sp. IB215182]MDX8351974.1 LytTR family DNA-binding domain-containing protein [Cognatiyoonia sp. IB215182]